MLKAVIVMGLFLIATAAAADTYTCTSVKDRATLGYDGSSKVSVVGKDKVCSFSIGGASVDIQERSSTIKDEQRDFDMLSKNPSDFIDKRLINLLREVAMIHGESGKFLLEAIGGVFSAPKISCSEGNSKQLGDLMIRCQEIGKDGSGSDGQFKAGVLLAEIDRPKFVIAVESDSSGSEGVYIFIKRLPRTQR